MDEIERWQSYWAQWDYTRPVDAALSAEFGVPFGATNTGGGCICITHDTPLEGGLYVYVGSAVDGPLWRHEHREQYHAEHGHYDGFGVGIVDENGYSVADASDEQAQTPAQVVELVKRALSLAALVTETTQQTWRRDWAGNVREETYPR